MTVPPSRTTRARRAAPSSTRATRSHAPRPLVGLITGLIAAALTVGVGAAPALAGTATTAGIVGADATPSPTPPAPRGSTTFTLAPIQNGILRPGENLTASVTIENGTTLATPVTEVTLAIGPDALSDRGALTAWLDTTDTSAASVPLGTATLEPVESGESRTAGITVAADAPELGGLAPGVYPLAASYTAPSGPVTSTSAVIVPRDDVSAGVGVVVPITAGPQTEALLTATELTELTSGTGALTSQLDGVDGTPAILAIDPALPASIRALGLSAPETATTWLDRLMTLPNPRFALQFGDADPAVQMDAGAPSPADPISFPSLLAEADFPPGGDLSTTPTPTPTANETTAPSATPPPSPSASAAPEGPTYPTLETLLDVGDAEADVFWPAATSATGTAISSLGALATGDDRSRTILPSTSVTAGATGATVGASATAGDAALLISDADVSRELSAASTIDATSLRGAPLTAATAYLAFAAADVGSADILIALERTPNTSYVGLQTAVSAAAEFPGATPRTLTELTEGETRNLALVDVPLPDEQIAAASALFADEGELGEFATILDDPALLLGVERAEILQLLGVAWAATPVPARIAVTEHRDATAATLGAVELVPTGTINLFAAGAGLPFTVRNDLPYPVNLVLHATPDDLRLNVQRTNDVVATPLSNTRVEVPVQARIGNGEVTLDLQLRSPSFVEIGPPDTVDVNVRAEWETIGIVALSVIVGGLLVFGVIRTVLRARNRRRGTDADADERPTHEEPPS